MKGDMRCVEGRLMRHDPQYDDPDLETDRGQCPECDGAGCDARLALEEQEAEEAAEETRRLEAEEMGRLYERHPHGIV